MNSNSHNTSTTRITLLIEDASNRLDEMAEMSGPPLAGQTVIVLGQLLEIIKLQEQRQQQAADRLDLLAGHLGNPLTPVDQTQVDLRKIVAILRGDGTAS
jgi:hypothetical protein